MGRSLTCRIDELVLLTTLMTEGSVGKGKSLLRLVRLVLETETDLFQRSVFRVVCDVFPFCVYFLSNLPCT